jgi:hypothetical protein
MSRPTKRIRSRYGIPSLSCTSPSHRQSQHNRMRGSHIRMSCAIKHCVYSRARVSCTTLCTRSFSVRVMAILQGSSSSGRRYACTNMSGWTEITRGIHPRRLRKWHTISTCTGPHDPICTSSFSSSWRLPPSCCCGIRRIPKRC